MVYNTVVCVQAIPICLLPIYASHFQIEEFVLLLKSDIILRRKAQETSLDTSMCKFVRMCACANSVLQKQWMCLGRLRRTYICMCEYIVCLYQTMYTIMQVMDVMRILLYFEAKSIMEWGTTFYNDQCHIKAQKNQIPD